MRQSEKNTSQADVELDLKPFINFLVVLIPVLMISAEFSKIAVVEASAMREGVNAQTADSMQSLSKNSNALGLTLLVSDSTLTLGTNSGFLPTVYYKEYHTYISRANRNNRLEMALDPHDPKKTPLNPATNKPFGVDERAAINLYVINDKREAVQCLYAKNGGMVTDEKGTPLSTVLPGEKVYVLGQFRALTLVAHAAEYSLKPLSVYDELRNRLLQVKERAGERPDRKSIRIAAEKTVVYDKIIQLMDVSKGADFGDISIGRVRG